MTCQMFWFMVRVDMLFLLTIPQNPLPTILVCSFVNGCASSPQNSLHMSFLLQATTLYPSKRKVSDKEGEFYFRYAGCI